MKQKYISLHLSLLVFSLVLFNGFAQEIESQQFNTFQKAVPNIFETTAGNNTFSGPFTTSQRTYQLLIAASELTALANKTLIGIAFRLPTSATSAYPTSDATANNYDIYLSGSVNPADRSFTFANNVVGTQTQVRSGSLLIPANALTSGSSPNAFSFTLNFTNNYLYSGGNLLIEIRHDGIPGTSRSIDAVGTSSSGYGTLFSALWASSYTATSTTTQGNFGVVNLITNEPLSNNEFNSSKVVLYPNPTRDVVYISGVQDVQKIQLYNALGQIIFEKSSDENAIDLTSLNNGTYFIHIQTISGSTIKKMVKY